MKANRCSMPCARWSSSATRNVIAGGGDRAGLGDQSAADSQAYHAGASPRRIPRGAGQRPQDARIGGGRSDGLKIATLATLNGQDGQISEVVIPDEARNAVSRLRCDHLLAFYGLTMEAGAGRQFRHQSARKSYSGGHREFETSVPRSFAIGDINSYPGKMKLILSGFHEAALMAKKAFRYIHPDRRYRFQYTTSSGELCTPSSASPDAAE